MKTVSIYLIKAAIILVLVTALLVLIGWQFDLALLKQTLPGSVAMNPMSAVAFLLSGFSFLLLLEQQRNKLRLTIATISVFLVLLIALLKLAAFFHLFDAGVDRLLYPEKILLHRFQSVPNSMAPNTAVGFLLTATTLLFYRFQKTIEFQYLSLFSCLLSLLSLIGYAYRVNAFYGVYSYIPMAFATAGCFFLLSMAILFVQSEKGFIAEITSPFAGGHAARVMLPVAILFPFLLGFFILLGSTMGFYSFSFATAVLVTGIIFIFSFLIWLTAAIINRVELERTLERQKANDELKKASAHVFDLYNNAPCGYHSIDANGYFTDMNDTELNWLGYKREEVMGKIRFPDVLSAESKVLFEEAFPVFLRTGVSKDRLFEMMRKDGTVFTVMISAISIRDQDGKFLRSRSTVIDYTERKKQEDQILQFNLELEKQVEEKTKQVIDKEQQYRFLIENMKEGIQVINKEWTYILINKAAKEHCMFANTEELTGYTLLEKKPGIEHTAYYRLLEHCMLQRVPGEILNEAGYADGRNRWFKLSVQPIPEGLLILSMDVTEQKKAEEKLRESNERYQFVNKATQDIIWEWDFSSGEGSWGDSLISIFGYAAEDLSFKENGLHEFVHPEDKERVMKNFIYHIENSIENLQDEYRFRCADGTYKEVLNRSFLLLDEHKKAYKIIGALSDLTEKKKLERELADERLEQQKLITAITIRAQEKERSELGRELHDNISQMLAVVKLYLGMLKNGQDPNGDLVTKSYDHLDTTIEEIRKLSHSLAPPSLGESGLEEALQNLVANTGISPDIAIQLKVDEAYNSSSTDKNKELMIYRIVQEQLNNTIKYAQASKISIQLKCNSENLYLSISDNGVGFDTSQTSKGIGLQNINSRVDFYSGKMSIISAPGKGCKLKVYIPY